MPRPVVLDEYAASRSTRDVNDTAAHVRLVVVRRVCLLAVYRWLPRANAPHLSRFAAREFKAKASSRLEISPKENVSSSIRGRS